jgi:hypothetical protein
MRRAHSLLNPNFDGGGERGARTSFDTRQFSQRVARMMLPFDEIGTLVALTLSGYEN